MHFSAQRKSPTVSEGLSVLTSTPTPRRRAAPRPWRIGRTRSWASAGSARCRSRKGARRSGARGCRPARRPTECPSRGSIQAPARKFRGVRARKRRMTEGRRDPKRSGPKPQTTTPNWLYVGATAPLPIDGGGCVIPSHPKNGDGRGSVPPTSLLMQVIRFVSDLPRGLPSNESSRPSPKPSVACRPPRSRFPRLARGPGGCSCPPSRRSRRWSRLCPGGGDVGGMLGTSEQHLIKCANDGRIGRGRIGP